MTKIGKGSTIAAAFYAASESWNGPGDTSRETALFSVHCSAICAELPRTHELDAHPFLLFGVHWNS